jgi:hypothetical protein
MANRIQIPVSLKYSLFTLVPFTLSPCERGTKGEGFKKLCEGFHTLMDLRGFSHNSFFTEACAEALGGAVYKYYNISPGNYVWDDLTGDMSKPEIDDFLHQNKWPEHNGSPWKSYENGQNTYYYFPETSEGGIGIEGWERMYAYFKNYLYNWGW